MGLYSRYVLGRGAAHVVAIEPEPTNLACLKMNLAEEIAAGKVTVVGKGVWDSATELEMSVPHYNHGANSFVLHWEDSHSRKLPVVPLDDLVSELQLEKVDFIKMDIEGAERRAIKGATETITRFRPRLAIAAYHLDDDPAAVSELIHGMSSGYRVHAKTIEMLWAWPRQKVLFFN